MDIAKDAWPRRQTALRRPNAGPGVFAKFLPVLIFILLECIASFDHLAKAEAKAKARVFIRWDRQPASQI
ncbi:hypothetical protein CFIMG_007765RA00001 [Ceratocystis fimbriata CBS 114723]|uniref:Uncharacterized protein n=1 Tax=Ceratocystis fimbriata CBS 114723 TaxID=1035309 RepID=A0A2C5XJI4_9PEZI|nr:hypothetical protein CFIMG_007765RA00001 [Ceratocystis fimbriata CBS 114723]